MTAMFVPMTAVIHRLAVSTPTTLPHVMTVFSATAMMLVVTEHALTIQVTHALTKAVMKVQIPASRFFVS
jgi:hypothetical protein